MTEPPVRAVPPIGAEPVKRLGMSTALIAVAMIELLGALSDLPDLFKGVNNLFGGAAGSGLGPTAASRTPSTRRST